MAVKELGISPSEFWKMTPKEFWALIETEKKPEDRMTPEILEEMQRDPRWQLPSTN